MSFLRRFSACVVLLSASFASAQTKAHTLPLVFEQNAGQLADGVAFAGRTESYALEVHSRELRFAFPGKSIRMEFVGALAAEPQGVNEASFRTNIYLGTHSASGIRNYDRVALRHLYPGIDVELYSSNSLLEHDFVLAPQADASQLAMHLSGAGAAKLSPEGDVILDSEAGALRLHKPVAYQLLANGSHQNVAARFVLRNGTELGFDLGAYDHARTLTIDPVITYATYVTGSAGSVPAAIQTDAAGNVYVAGYTSSAIASFGAASTNGTAVPTSANQVAYLARLTATASGSQIAWLTYFGSTASVLPAALALQPSSNTLYLGGQTTATSLPGIGTTFQSSVSNGFSFGFVSTFSTATGTLGATTYVDGAVSGGGTTNVTALAADSAGSIYIGGNTTGNALPTFNGLSGNGLAAVIANTSLNKPFILKLDKTLTTESYGTYIAGNNANTTVDTFLNGLAVDSSGNIYISGYTRGNFPQAGAFATAAINTPVAGKLGGNTFAAQLIPATATLGWSYWSGASSDVQNTGLLLDASNNLYLFGQTLSPDLITKGATTTIYSSSANSTTTPIDANFPSLAYAVGYALRIDSTGKLLTTTFLGSNGSGTNSILYGAAYDASGNIYLAGRTNGIKASFPQKTSGSSTASITGVVSLPTAQDLSADSTASTLTFHAVLLQLPQNLASVSSRAYFGPSAGASSAIGVATDAATPAHTYVSIQNTPTAATSTYSTASSAEPAAQIADGSTVSGYVAQLGFAVPGSSASITLTTPTYSPSIATYISSGTYTTETFTWKITGASSGASNVVFNLPYSKYLQPYALSMLTLNGAALPANTCTLSTATTNTTPGITCVLASLASGTSATFALTDGVSSAVATALSGGATTISIPAQAFDAQSDSLDLTITLPIGNIPTLTLTNSVSTTSVNGALSATDTATPTTTVAYTYVIKNTSTYDSPATKLTTNLGSGFTVTASSSSTSCDPTTATNGCDVPAGGTLTYTVTGKYLAAQFGSTTSGPFLVTVSAPSISYTPGTNSLTATTTGATTVRVAANSALAVALSTSTATQGSGFRLGDSGVQLIATVTNSGVNQAASVGLTVTLPTGFTAASSVATSGTGSANCASSPYRVCTFTSIPGAGGKAVFTITGSWNDTGLANDAVAPPATSASPSAATVVASATSGSVTVAVPSTGVTVTGGYAPATTAASQAITVYRSNTLANSLTAVTPLPGNLTNVLNPADTNDQVSYIFGTTNTGTSVVRGLLFSIPLPSAANFSAASITASGGVSTANQLTCAPYNPGDAKITCYTNDLTAVPTAATTTPAATAYTVTFTGTFAPATIPSGSNSTTVTQSAPALAAAATTYNTGTAGTVSPAAITVQKIPQTLTFTSPGNVTYGVAPLTLAATSSANVTPITYTAAGPATVSGSTLTITGVGSVTVVASQAGDAVNAPATASVTFTVTPAALSVTAANASRNYGAANPTFTVNVTGAVNGDTFTTAASTTATASSTVGNYSIVPTISGAALANYTVTLTNGTLSVTPAPIIFAAANATRLYGTANPAFTVNTTGALNGDTFTTSASTSAVLASPVGSYSITPTTSGSALVNYAPTYVAGALSITQAGTSTVVVSSLPIAGTVQTFTLTATVTSLTTGTPTGTVQFYAGSTLLGAGTILNGTTTLQASITTTGGYSITAVYSGDLNFTGSTSASATQVIITPDFSISAQPSAFNVSRGGSGTTVFTVTTTGGYNQPIVFSCSGLPNQASCSFSPFAITPPTTTSTQLTVTAAASVGDLRSEPTPWSNNTKLELATLGLLLCLVRRRKRFASLAALGLIALLTTSLAGCSSATTTQGTPAGTYTLTITASSGTTHTSTVTITVK